MENDPETQLYKDIAELRETVPKLQGELESQGKSLKTRMTKLANRLSQVEAMDFQQQIVALDEKLRLINDRINKLATSQGVLERAVCVFRLYSVQDTINLLLIRYGGANLLPQLIADATNAKHRILTNSQNPLDIVHSFQDTWEQRVRSLNANADFIKY